MVAKAIPSSVVDSSGYRQGLSTSIYFNAGSGRARSFSFINADEDKRTLPVAGDVLRFFNVLRVRTMFLYIDLEVDAWALEPLPADPARLTRL